ncbi:hypothetical protein VNO77_15070 [Canavalia gladiata]|uniref:Uncharacterized protein n=1 Tax=Canavalia gladiata TaxID=3824 RepID=A0AAN9M2C1_CANGL
MSIGVIDEVGKMEKPDRTTIHERLDGSHVAWELVKRGSLLRRLARGLAIGTWSARDLDARGDACKYALHSSPTNQEVPPSFYKFDHYIDRKLGLGSPIVRFYGSWQCAIYKTKALACMGTSSFAWSHVEPFSHSSYWSCCSVQMPHASSAFDKCTSYGFDEAGYLAKRGFSLYETAAVKKTAPLRAKNFNPWQQSHHIQSRRSQ